MKQGGVGDKNGEKLACVKQMDRIGKQIEREKERKTKNTEYQKIKMENRKSNMQRKRILGEKLEEREKKEIIMAEFSLSLSFSFIYFLFFIIEWKSTETSHCLQNIDDGIQDVKMVAVSIIKIHGANITSGIASPQNSVRSCLLYTSPSPRDRTRSRMPSSA